MEKVICFIFYTFVVVPAWISICCSFCIWVDRCICRIYNLSQHNNWLYFYQSSSKIFASLIYLNCCISRIFLNGKSNLLYILHICCCVCMNIYLLSFLYLGWSLYLPHLQLVTSDLRQQLVRQLWLWQFWSPGGRCLK